MTFQPWKQAFNNLPNQFYRNSSSSNGSSGNKNTDSELSPTFTSKMKNGDVENSADSIPNLNQLSHQFDLSDSQSQQQQHFQSPINSTNNVLHQIEGEQPVAKSALNGTKFSIFSQLLNLNKINAFDNLLLNASMSLDEEDLNGDKRLGMKKLMEQAIR
jgi:hypothetical protein